MKKLIWLICLTVSILTLTACGAPKPQPEPSDTAQSTASTEAPDTGSQTTSSTQAPDTPSTQTPDTDPLKIKVQPQNTTVMEGETATFSIEAEGGKAPYDYMWLVSFSGGEMPANQELQTDTIAFPNVDLSYDGETYFCRVTDADNNMVESEKVKITVTPDPDKNTVTLSFYLEDGSTFYTSMEVEKGQPFGTLPTPPDNPGYIFMAWADKHGMPFYPESTIYSDLTLYATWREPD